MGTGKFEAKPDIMCENITNNPPTCRSRKVMSHSWTFFSPNLGKQMSGALGVLVGERERATERERCGNMNKNEASIHGERPSPCMAIFKVTLDGF